MTYTVRDVDIHAQKDLLLKILKLNRKKDDYPFEKRYDWLYFDNPYGKAKAWIIWDDKNNYPAGFTAVYPRKMLVKGKEYLCWNCGDFSIEKKYRTLGIALKLRKEAKKYIDQKKVPFLYAHPNNKMVHIHLRSGHNRIAYMKRYAFPLRLSKQLKKIPFGEFAGSVIDPVFTTILKIKNRPSGNAENFAKSEMSFNTEYKNLCTEINKKYPVIGLRDQNYLTWKYKNHPIIEWNLFNFRIGDELKGYIIYFNENGVITLLEIVSLPEKDIQINMLKSFIHFIMTKDKSVQVLTTHQQEFNPIVASLVEIGFKYRDDATNSAIAYSADPELADTIHNGKDWFMNAGDRDA